METKCEELLFHMSSESNKYKVTAIALCNKNKIIESLSYGEIFDMCDLLDEIFVEMFSNSFVGLFMKQHINLPVILLCLKKVNCPFVFLSKNSFEKAGFMEDFDDTVGLDENSSLFIWRTKVNKQKQKATDNQNIFCEVHTSGSTGEPKKIQVPLNCIGENALHFMENFEITSADKILWTTPLTFDPSLIEFLLSFFSGASLFIVSYDTYLNQNHLLEVIKNNNITFFQVVPSILLRWDNRQIEHLLNETSLRIVALGGEEFPKHILEIPRKQNLQLYNLYGLSELSCWASVHELTTEKGDTNIPLGKNLPDTTLITKECDSDLLDNNTGTYELFLKSDSRFCIVNGISNKNESIPTGDLVRISNKSELYYVGRKNKLIKRFGNRINLTKIEDEIFEKTGFKNKCIWSQNLSKLLCFILIENCDYITRLKVIDKIRVKLLHALSKEHFPDHFQGISKFPLNSHGKLDETILDKYYANSIRQNTESISNTDISEIFSRLCFQYLGIPSESLGDYGKASFFELGGNSILAMQFLSEFKEIVNIEIPEGLTQCLFQNTLGDCLSCLKIETINVKRVSNADCNENRQKIMKTLNDLHVKWKYDLKACVDCTPLVFEKGENSYIAVGSYSHIFVVIDQNGQEVTKIVLPNVIESTPCLSSCKTLLYVGCFDAKLYCIDYMKNSIVWKYCTEDRIKSSPLLCINSTAVAIGSYDQYVHCIKSENGSLIWKTSVQGNIAASIVKSDKFLYVATTTGHSYCLSEDKGDILWDTNIKSPIFGSPCIINDQGILWPNVEGTISCTSIEGTIKETFKADGLIFSSLVSYNKHIYFGCIDGYLYKVKYVKNSFECVSKVLLDSAISTSPCLDEKNKLLVATCNSGFVYLLNLETFAILYSCKLSGEIFSSPILHQNNIYVGCRDNYLYCVKADDAE